MLFILGRPLARRLLLQVPITDTGKRTYTKRVIGEGGLLRGEHMLMNMLIEGCVMFW